MALATNKVHNNQTGSDVLCIAWFYFYLQKKKKTKKEKSIFIYV